MEELNKAISQLEHQDVLENIKFQEQGGYLSLDAIAQIGDAAIKVSIPKYVEMVKKYRNGTIYKAFLWSLSERRAVFDDLQKYIDLWEKHAEEFEVLLYNSMSEVLEEKKIEESRWEKSNTYYMEQGNQEIASQHMNNVEKLR